jgi:hypothetical protein
MRIMGFSTGALAYGDFRRALDMLKNKKTTAVELSALREHELAPLVDALDLLDLSDFKYVSVHSPSSFDKAHESEVVALLGKVVARNWPIVVHPNTIYTPSKWNSFAGLLLVENMDKRSVEGRTALELSALFTALPRAGLCFDAGHCRQVDSTMNEAYAILSQFRNRLKQVHVSEVNSRSTHDPLSGAAIRALEQISHLIPENVPIILESVVGEDELEAEICKAKYALSSAGQSRQAEPFYAFVG